jgi:RHS repeat-associated protein
MEWDSDAGPSGLYNTWFRHYDVNQARWMTVDPVNGKPDQPQTFNLFTHVANDPGNLVDPLGLDYMMCSLDGFCGSLSNAEFISFRNESSSSLFISMSGSIYAINSNGSLTYIGYYFYYDPKLQQEGQMNPFGAAVLAEVWKSIGFIAEPVCSGGAFVFVGGGGRIPGTSIQGEVLAIPINYDSKEGFSSGVIAELGAKRSPASTGVEFSYNWQTKKPDAAGLGFAGRKWKSGRWGTIQIGILVDGNNNTFGFYAGNTAGGGAYFQPSFLGGCR